MITESCALKTSWSWVARRMSRLLPHDDLRHATISIFLYRAQRRFEQAMLIGILGRYAAFSASVYAGNGRLLSLGGSGFHLLLQVSCCRKCPVAPKLGQPPGDECHDQ